MEEEIQVEEVPLYQEPLSSESDFYRVEYIKEDICNPLMEYNSIDEFAACQAWATTESVLAFGNIIVGIILGFIIIKGLFDSWR